MYAFIRGTLVEATLSSATLDCSGVGYLIFIPPSVYSGLPQKGKEACLHTSFIVREQSQALYGFLSTEERDLFEKLLTVNGIGPKSALSLIGHLPLKHFHDAIAHEDLAALCKVPGIGKKTAERLLIDMRGKVKSSGPINHTARDAMSAMINLGYSQAAAEKAVEKVLKTGTKMDLPELITKALKSV